MSSSPVAIASNSEPTPSVRDPAEFVRRVKQQDAFRLMLDMATPTIVAVLLFGLNTTADGLLVARLVGANALAGMSLAYPLVQLIQGMGTLVGTGAATLLGIQIGRGSTEGRSAILVNVIALAMALSIPVAIVCRLFAPELIAVLGAFGDAGTQGVSYLRASAPGIPFVVVGFGLNLLLRGEGAMKTAMVLSAIGLLANLVLTPILIVVFGLGVAGAAWGANAGMVIFAAAHVVLFTRTKGWRWRLDALSRGMTTQILKMGFASFLLFVLMLAQQYLVIRRIGRSGTATDLALWGMTNRIVLLCVLPIYGMARSLQPMVSVCWGARDLTRLKEIVATYLKWGTGFLTLAVAPLLLAPSTMLRLWLPEIATSAVEVRQFVWFMLALPLWPAALFTINTIQSMGQGGVAALLVIARQIALFAPMMALFSHFMGITGIYATFPAVDFIVAAAALTCLWRLFVRDWAAAAGSG